MEFRTKIKIPTATFTINHNDQILSLGSCFSNTVAKRLKDNQFKIHINPFGVLYNPISIANSLNRIISGSQYIDEDLNKNDGLYLSFDHHSSFNSTNKNDILDNINKSLMLSKQHFEKTTLLLITFGTAFAYELKKNKKIVSNCHKLRSSEFSRILLQPEIIVETYNKLIDTFKETNPKLKLIVTISPIRHLRDSAYENQVSKSHLFTAVNKIISQNKNVQYFPSYEIMMDELRDYRFYAEDMVHPSKIAEDYIFNKFIENFTDKDSRNFIDRYSSIKKAKSHTLMTDDKNSIYKFRESMLKKVNALQKIFPDIDLSKDINFFKSI